MQSLRYYHRWVTIVVAVFVLYLGVTGAIRPRRAGVEMSSVAHTSPSDERETAVTCYRLRFLLPAAALLGASVLPSASVMARAAISRPSAAEASLLATEDGMLKAKIARDSATIARGMADEVTYTHATGRVQTKADYLQSLTEGKTDYRSIRPVDRVVRVSGDLGITHGTLRMAVGERTLQDSYLAAYVRRQGRWQLLFWQTSPAPGATPMGPAPHQPPSAGARPSKDAAPPKG